MDSFIGSVSCKLCEERHRSNSRVSDDYDTGISALDCLLDTGIAIFNGVVCVYTLRT